MILCPLKRFPISLVIFIEASFFITNKSTSNGFVFRLYSFSNISPVLSCANSRFMAATNPGCHCIFLSFIESPLYIKIITHTPKFLQPQTKLQILFEFLSAQPLSFRLSNSILLILVQFQPFYIFPKISPNPLQKIPLPLLFINPFSEAGFSPRQLLYSNFIHIKIRADKPRGIRQDAKHGTWLVARRNKISE